MHRFFIVCILSLVIILTSFDSKDDRLISVERVKQDLFFLKTNLEKYHPSLYRYEGPDQIESYYDSLIQSIRTPKTELEVYALTKLMIAMVKDGHTGSSQPPRLEMSSDVISAKYFPFKLYTDGQRAWVLGSHDLKILPGFEITAINCVPVKIIIENLERFVSTDGFNRTRKSRFLNRNFHFYYRMCYGSFDKFQICYKKPGSRRSKNYELKGVNLAEADGMDYKDHVQPSGNGLLEISYPEKDLAIMTIRTMDNDKLSKSPLSFAAFLWKNFKEIREKAITRLIIDIRNNGGGNDLNGALLMAFLAGREIEYYKSLTVITKDLPYPALGTSAISYKSFDSTMLDTAGPGRWKIKDEFHPNLGTIVPTKDVYKGRVVLLTNGTTFSTAAEFAAIFKSEQRGIQVGEETGGGYNGNTSGVFKDITLPNSNINVYIPLIKYELKVNDWEPAKGGVIPFKIVVPTIDDIINGKDVQMEEAKKHFY